MNKVYYVIENLRCACDCGGQGQIVVLKCQACNHLIGGCSEIDFNAYSLASDGLKFGLNREAPYACPVCGAESESQRYATSNEIIESGCSIQVKGQSV